MAEYIEFQLSPSKLPQDLRAAIGFVVAAASQTENLINWAIGGCLGIDAEYMIAVTQHMTLPLKFDVLHAVAEIRIDDLDALDILDELLTTARNAIDKRNSIVHDTFGVAKTDGRLFRLKQTARGSVEAESIPITVEQIIADAGAIEASGLALMIFLQEHGLIPATPSGRPRGHKTRAARKARRSQPIK